MKCSFGAIPVWVSFLFGSLSASGAPVQLVQDGASDPHPFQNQTVFRLHGISESSSEIFEVLLPQSVAEAKYFMPGEGSARTLRETQVVHEKRTPFLQTRLSGVNYFFTDGNDFSTIDADGNLYYQGHVDSIPAQAGGVFYLESNSHEVTVIDSYGYPVHTGLRVGDPKVLGGNYLIDSQGVLTTLKSIGITAGSGVGIATRKEGWRFLDVVAAGGNFFVRKDQSLVSINSVNGFFEEGIIPPSKPMTVGGNWFFGEDGQIYTFNHEGKLRANPDFFRGEHFSSPVEIGITGYSFFTLQSGELITIDSDGLPHRSVIRVSPTGIDSEKIDFLPFNEVDLRSIFVPHFLK